MQEEWNALAAVCTDRSNGIELQETRSTDIQNQCSGGLLPGVGGMRTPQSRNQGEGILNKGASLISNLHNLGSCVVQGNHCKERTAHLVDGRGIPRTGKRKSPQFPYCPHNTRREYRLRKETTQNSCQSHCYTLTDGLLFGSIQEIHSHPLRVCASHAHIVLLVHLDH